MGITEKEERLRLILNEAQADRDVADMILRQASGILIHLGMTQVSANRIIMSMLTPSMKDLRFGEEILHKTFVKAGTFKLLPQAMEVRANAWISKISWYFGNPISVLDLGCGSGEVASGLSNLGYNVTCSDVISYRITGCDLPFVTSSDSFIDMENGAVDLAVVLTVLHHADDPDALIKEVFRVANRVIIIESVVNEGRFSELYAAWIDWFYNRVVHFSPDPKLKVNVPCNFRSSSAWEADIRDLTGRRPTISKPLGIFQWLNPEWHHLYVYD